MAQARDPQSLAEAIDRLLPQTQCAQCGYTACEPYAIAIAAGEAEINRCPPGGGALIEALAQLLGREPAAPDPACGPRHARSVALIDEAQCIGCTLCIQACPVDAILGAPKLMHTVLTELCTGCELCVPPCPVDCIALVPPPAGDPGWTPARAAAARNRFDARRARLARIEEERRLGMDTRAEDGAQRKHAVVRAAIERARARREGRRR